MTLFKDEEVKICIVIVLADLMVFLLLPSRKQYFIVVSARRIDDQVTLTALHKGAKNFQILPETYYTICDSLPKVFSRVSRQALSQCPILHGNIQKETDTEMEKSFFILVSARRIDDQVTLTALAQLPTKGPKTYTFCQKLVLPFMILISCFL